MTQHLPVTLAADGKATPSPTGNSGDFIGLLRSDGFITIPPRAEFAAAYRYTPWF
jgi:molybdopterin biosynthesis enzyme